MTRIYKFNDPLNFFDLCKSVLSVGDVCFSYVKLGTHPGFSGSHALAVVALILSFKEGDQVPCQTNRIVS